MTTVTAPLWLWTGEGGSWHFVTIPEEDAVAFRAESLARRGGSGSVKVEATIEGPATGSGDAVTWRTSVFPQKSGGYILPVKAKVRREAGISAGDTITVRLDLIFG